jgi:alpha-L-arabinofuranosidase
MRHVILRLAGACIIALASSATTAHTAPPPVGRIDVDLNGSSIDFDPDLILGSNFPSWLGKATFEDTRMRARMKPLGPGYLRVPGGGFANEYGWLSCELGDNAPGAATCGPKDNASGDYFWKSFVARPTDYINLLNATKREALWIVNHNATKEESAALVAFMNGKTDDPRPIGIDAKGTDWKTVGHWAQLRAANGNPDPVGIKYFDYGNEIFGGQFESGTDCTFAYGWTVSWTCDGTEYIKGKGAGADRKDGYLATRAAMKAVDPSIQLGAVALDVPSDFNNFGNKILIAAGGNIDYLAVHSYPFFSGNRRPDSLTAVLARPQTHLKQVRAALNESFAKHNGGKAIPISLNEYNMWGVFEDDTEQLMRKQINALFMADYIGQMIQTGMRDGAQWALINASDTEPGKIYGMMIGSPDYVRTPQYWVYVLWRRFGKTMIPASTSLDPEKQVAVYAGRPNKDSVSVLVINKQSMTVTVDVFVKGAKKILAGQRDEAWALNLLDDTATFNGNVNPNDALSNARTRKLKRSNDNVMRVTLQPNSTTLLRLKVKR